MYIYIYIYIYNIPFASSKFQIQNKICKLSFVFLLTYLKIQDFFSGMSSLITSFRLFVPYSFLNKNLRRQNICEGPNSFCVNLLAT